MGRHARPTRGGILLSMRSEKQEANRAATASHGELPRLPSREGRKTQKLKGEEKLERRADTRVPRGREARHTWRRCAPEGMISHRIE
ncbi:hypothetical protein AVEN_231609-1 [Araneus ventricosus]|uniref:Uncharacterized protein n=1 Tax=Araneus ventricosus TaxID=182803 RepID=A0A4Y2HD33_ARAVE|nr:hypothetical protein AVEN_264930-1 [Araneus ventricosus]GBM63182.1 hypothetical protein AVEN_231609-1 [Araneus ventricosus]